MDSKDTTPLYQTIQDRCDALGITISDLSRASGVDRQLFNNWRLKVPKTLDLYYRIDNALKELENQKQNA